MVQNHATAYTGVARLPRQEGQVRKIQMFRRALRVVCAQIHDQTGNPVQLVDKMI